MQDTKISDVTAQKLVIHILIINFCALIIIYS